VAWGLILACGGSGHSHRLREIRQRGGDQGAAAIEEKAGLGQDLEVRMVGDQLVETLGQGSGAAELVGLGRGGFGLGALGGSRVVPSAAQGGSPGAAPRRIGQVSRSG
jgi:hypothetical protein